MKWQQVMAAAVSATMILSLAACGGSGKNGGSGGDVTDVKYADIKLGEDYTDLKADLKMMTNRTDMLDEGYTGEKTWAQYLEEFNKEYPDIKVDIEGITDYSEDSLLRLQGGDWGDIMMIPEVDKSDLSTYFLSYGDVDSVSEQVKYPNRWLYDGEVYGLPITAVGRGIVYNKRVFSEAGITSAPKTPEEFLEALKKLKGKTQAPLYTNYAAGWTMGAWDDYTAVAATGDGTFRNQKLVHAKAPFSDPGDGTGAYNVYKILYDAVEQGLTEDDFSTTDWEGSKNMLNSGQISCMVLGSWAYPQVKSAGDKGEDIGYMPFPMTIGGKQYSPADEDYCFGINVSSSADNQTAALVFVKWMTEKSGYSYNEGGLPLAVGDENYPEVYDEFLANNVEFVSNEPALEGEEDTLNELNADSELMVAANGNDKIQEIVEHASNKDKSFDDIMKEWNQKWSDAQEMDGVEVK